VSANTAAVTTSISAVATTTSNRENPRDPLLHRALPILKASSRSHTDKVCRFLDTLSPNRRHQDLNHDRVVWIGWHRRDRPSADVQSARGRHIPASSTTEHHTRRISEVTIAGRVRDERRRRRRGESGSAGRRLWDGSRVARCVAQAGSVKIESPCQGTKLLHLLLREYRPCGDGPFDSRSRPASRAGQGRRRRHSEL